MLRDWAPTCPASTHSGVVTAGCVHPAPGPFHKCVQQVKPNSPLCPNPACVALETVALCRTVLEIPGLCESRLEASYGNLGSRLRRTSAAPQPLQQPDPGPGSQEFTGHPAPGETTFLQVQSLSGLWLRHPTAWGRCFGAPLCRAGRESRGPGWGLRPLGCLPAAQP